MHMGNDRTKRGAMNFKSWLVSLALCAIAGCGAASAASQQDWDACSGKGAAPSTAACGRIVADESESAQNRADAYLFRAGTYLSQGNADGAIADYGEAIRLAPRNAVAYASRAVAYLQKGDREHAVIDYALARRLDPAMLASMAAANPQIGQIAELERAAPPASLPPATVPTPAPPREASENPGANFAGTYEGLVERHRVDGTPDASRTYRLTMNPDGRNGTVWIYSGSELLYVLLFSGMREGTTFTGKTRPVQDSSGNYKPDEIKLEFAPDGRSVRWYHSDGTMEGSGTLKRV
jgi:tetratricopeptide (TPR) repeat protein